MHIEKFLEADKAVLVSFFFFLGVFVRRYSVKGNKTGVKKINERKFLVKFSVLNVGG